jgi:ABC-type sugar transport system ATPase subunit
MSNVLLEVQHISHSWEGHEVLHDLSFEVPASKITVILGANGTGKSTLLRLMAGFVDTQQGKILFDGQKVRGPGCMLIPGHPSIALVRQDSKLSPNISVKENLLYVLRAYEDDYQAKKIEELSNLLVLGHIMERTVNFLSGGEKQRVAIAAALASGPELLLMDEPFSQTDMYLKQELKQFLTKIVEQLGIGLLFVTHDPQDALALASEIIVLHEGKVVEKGSSRQLYYHPQHEATATLTGLCSWLPTKSFPDLKQLHRIGENWLVRPDQVTMSPTQTEEGLKMTVSQLEFLGAHYLAYLQSKKTSISIITLLPSLTTLAKKGQTVWVNFLGVS